MYRSIYGHSGLSEKFEKIYGKNALFHMMQSKAYARALRGL